MRSHGLILYTLVCGFSYFYKYLFWEFISNIHFNIELKYHAVFSCAIKNLQTHILRCSVSYRSSFSTSCGPLNWPMTVFVVTERYIYIKSFFPVLKVQSFVKTTSHNLWETHWSQLVSTLVIRSSDLGLRSEQQDILGKTIVLSQCLSVSVSINGTLGTCVWERRLCTGRASRAIQLVEILLVSLTYREPGWWALTRLKHRSLHKSAKNSEEN